jgi:2-methylcitrate dehydratase PrpD
MDALVAAVVVGYEVSCRIGAARRWELVDAYATGHWCGYGAAAAVAWLRRSEPRALAQAFSIFGAHRPIVYPRGMGMNPNGIKEAIPWATQTAMIALGLAEAGLTGPENALDDGLLDVERVIHGFGSEPFFVESLYFKPYACCAWVHGAAEGLCGLVEDHALELDSIRRVRVQTYAGPLMLDNDPDPPTIYHAQYSYPFALAVAAHHGLDGLRPLSVGALGDPKLVEFAKRVTLEVDEAFEGTFPNQRRVRVVLETDSGTFERQVDQERNPEDEAALVEKFVAMTRGVCEPSRQERLARTLLESDDIALLSAELREPLAGKRA